MPDPAERDAEWRTRLTPEQYHITREKGTEPPFTGAYVDYHGGGTFTCVCCGAPIFASDAKFDSGTGWPSFHSPVAPDRVHTEDDHSHGMVRTEVQCAACAAHLGHVFPDGPRPTGLRYCINSAALQLDLESATGVPGRIDSVWIKRAHGEPMERVERAAVEAGRGLVGNANQGGKRQITLLEQENWDRFMTQVAVPVGPEARRANLVVRGVSLRDSRGRTLRVGDVRIRIHGETKPCGLMDQTCPGLKRLMQPDWGGGAYGEPLDDGTIGPGDLVRWEPGETSEGSGA